MAVLGDLEQHVMAVLWRAQRPLSVRETHELLHYNREVAYTTVMTVLDRLAKKNVVARELDRRAWLYRSLKSCVDLHADEILSLLAGCGEGHVRSILAQIDERMGEVVVPGQDSCLTTGDPTWTPPVRSCAFLAACRAAELSCGDCPSSRAAS